jgi:hypothetical protein
LLAASRARDSPTLLPSQPRPHKHVQLLDFFPYDFPW